MKWLLEEPKPESANFAGDKYTWVYLSSIENGHVVKRYLAGTAGRMTLSDARFTVDALNEFSLCIGEGK